MNKFGSRSETEGAAYVALLGDVVAHREAEDWPRRIGELQRTLAELAGEDPERAPLALTSGDQLSGFFAARPDRVVATVVRLAEAIHPLRIAWGLGRGPMTTPLELDLPLLGGPCFHRARDGLDAARRQGRWVVARGFGEVEDGVLSALFGLMDAIRSRWTETQLRYARAARTGLLRKDVAESFGVNPSVVTESLQAASFRTLQRGEEAAEVLLARFAPGRGP